MVATMWFYPLHVFCGVLNMNGRRDYVPLKNEILGLIHYHSKLLDMKGMPMEPHPHVINPLPVLLKYPPNRNLGLDLFINYGGSWYLRRGIMSLLDSSEMVLGASSGPKTESLTHSDRSDVDITVSSQNRRNTYTPSVYIYRYIYT
jgi:hypothetical protein